jgi:hypothetical protein
VRLSGNARVAAVAAVCWAVPLAANAVAAFLTDWTGLGAWLIAPALGLLGAVVTALIEKSPSPAFPPPPPPPPSGRDGGRRARRPAGPGPTAAGVLAVVLVVLVVGVGVALGVRFVVGYITGDETGTQVLVQPATGGTAGLSATVDGVEYTDHFTRVSLVATNGGGASVSLPLFGYCVFSGSDGTTLQADPFRSDWADSLPPGGRQRGVVVFPGHLPDAVAQASLSFTTVFGPGGGDAMTVGPLILSPVGASALPGPGPRADDVVGHR